jgi:Peptidase family M13
VAWPGASEGAEAVVAFETRVAGASWTRTQQCDPVATYNPMTPADLQKMPMHAGSYGCSSNNLRQVDANICHSARLLHRYLVRSGSLQVALRRYNGCVRSANTPRCERYPLRGLRTTSRVRQDVLASAADMGLIVPASVSVAPRTADSPVLTGRPARTRLGSSS